MLLSDYDHWLSTPTRHPRTVDFHDDRDLAYDTEKDDAATEVADDHA
jgi:hypothetical protein